MAQCSQCGGELERADDPCPRCGAGERDPLIGQELLGRYRIVRVLAEGGMGRVYLAEQAVGSISRQVAVKVLRTALGTDRQLVSRFSREAETLVRLTHPNTVQLFDFGALPDGTLALVMEYVEGHTLASEIARGPLPLARVERILTQLCGALKEAHTHGIVHRDLKPDNVLIKDRMGHGDFVKVLDFGIAKVSAAEEATTTKLTQQGMIIGTPPYMSPEQFSGGPVDARSDVYSLGVIVFEMLTGQLPFTANTPWEWASKHLTAEPASLDTTRTQGLAPRHAEAIRRALRKPVDERLQTIDALLDAFVGRAGSDAVPAPSSDDASVREGRLRSGATVRDDASDGRPSAEVVTYAAMRSMPWRRVALAGGLIGLLAVAVGAFVWVGGSSRSGSSAPAPLPQPVRAATQAAASLPTGVAPPAGDEPTRAVEAARPGTAPERRRTVPRTASARPMKDTGTLGRTPTIAPPSAPVPVEPKANKAPPEPVSNPPKPERSPPQSSGEVPPDLAQRISKIREAAARPEVAVSLFQAASARYGSHPALSPLRGELTRMGEQRINQLLAGGRCAQAQALQRALASIGAASSGSNFGGVCPPP